LISKKQQKTGLKETGFHLKGGVCALNNANIILTFFKSSSKTIK